MKNARQLLGAVSAITLVVLNTVPAMAQGTLAGEQITNNVSVSFNVGGVAQTAETDSDVFYVDRKVNVVVTAVGTSPNVANAQTGIVREFSIENLSNDDMGYALTVSQEAGAAFAISNVVIFIDADNDNVVDSGEAVTYIDTLAPDAVQNVKVRFDVPNGVADGTTTDLILTANAVEPGSAGATEVVDSTGANTAGTSATDIETVLADAAGETDAANAGDHSAKHTITVDAANISVAKTSTIISDPVNGSTNPMAIPGAVVEYCIVVSNAAGATATGINVTDDFSSEAASLEFLADAYASGGDIMVDGDGSCAGGTAVDKGYTPTTTAVANGLSDIAASEELSLRFRVTIR